MNPSSANGRATPLRLWRLSWAEWRAHPWRQVAALVSVALGVALAFSVHLINNSALAEFSSAVRAANGEPDLSFVGPQAGFDEALLDRVASRAGVLVAHPRVEIDTVALLAAAGEPAAASANGSPAPSGQDPPARSPVRLLGIDALQVAAVAPELMPRPSEAASRLAFLDPTQVFVNATLARQLGAATTLTVLAQGRPLSLQVAGTVAAGGAALAVIDIAAAQARFGFAGRLSRIDVRLAPGQGREALLAGLALPADVRMQVPEDASQRVSNLSRAYRVNLTVLALVALVVGAFLVFSVVSLAVAQRTPGFALLGVLGMSAADRRALVLAECAVTGVAASALGIALGTAMAAAALRLLAGDLGGGYFTGVAPPLRFSVPAAFVFAALGSAAAVAGGWWPAAQAARLSPALALKGLGQLQHQAPPWAPGVLLLAAAGALALLPPVGELPLAAYASVAALLVGGIALVPFAVFALLGRRGAGTARQPLVLLALQRARFFRATATAAVAGVVASLALSVALTVMVASFRDAVSQWLETILPADLYVRTTPSGVFFPSAWVAQASALDGVARVSPGRSLGLLLQADRPEVWLTARDLGADPARALPLIATPEPLPPGETGVFVSEAMQALYGAQPGQVLTLPLGGRAVALRVRGVWRDYARQFGSVAMALADYQRLTGDRQLNELALWLKPGVGVAEVQAALRERATQDGGDAASLGFASTAQLKTLSLQIFDRSFAVTRYLQGVAIAIGLAGVAASLSSQVLARRREFGLLTHLGLTRTQLLRLVTLETACWLLAGIAVGLGLGLAISVVLVYVVNPQSFHWTMPLQVPLPQVGALALGVLLAGGLTSALTARHAASADAVRSVKEDW